MNDTYYIIVTVIFGVFVIVMLWWLWTYFRRPKDIMSTKHEDLTDHQKLLIYKFCNEKRQERLKAELETKKRSRKSKGG